MKNRKAKKRYYVVLWKYYGRVLAYNPFKSKDEADEFIELNLRPIKNITTKTIYL